MNVQSLRNGRDILVQEIKVKESVKISPFLYNFDMFDKSCILCGMGKYKLSFVGHLPISPMWFKIYHYQK